jgi:flagellar biosynthesis/type III secretory pathway chaperone
MKIIWEEIAEHLRTEVAEYGALLHLFEEQQRLLFKRDAAGVVMTTTALDAQVYVLQEVRQRREASVSAFALANGEPPAAKLRSLIPLVAREAQPLIAALVADINRLISRVRRASRQNRLFLSRTIENQQEIIRKFRPEAVTRTYSPSGRASYAAIGQVASLVAEG